MSKPGPYRPTCRTRGFSLTELLLTLGLAAILAGAATPGFLALVSEHRASADVNALLGAVRNARALAILHNQAVRLCAGPALVCEGADDWRQGAFVFFDSNDNRRVDNDETVALRLAPVRTGARIRWRSFRNRRDLLFRGSGLTDWQNGNFHYCPADQDPALARQLILNAQGRARLAVDSDGDGVREDARGRPLTCP